MSHVHLSHPLKIPASQKGPMSIPDTALRVYK